MGSRKRSSCRRWDGRKRVEAADDRAIISQPNDGSKSLGLNPALDYFKTLNVKKK